jgi:hypothetical protein
MAAFRSKAYDPIVRFGREFALSDAVKKKAFQTKLLEIYIHQRLCERVQELCEEFEANGALPHLVDKYQSLDYEMACALRAAAKSVGRADFGYQRSPDLVRAGRAITMWRFIIQCISAKWDYTDRIHSLAQFLGLPESEHVDISLKHAHSQLATARRVQREVMRNDSDKRQHWLEEIADAIALDNPDSDKEAILRQMISRSRATATHRKLSNIYKPHGGAIKLTKVPHHDWYYDPRIDELYHFDDGVFYAHPSVGWLAPDDERIFETYFEVKKPPDHIYWVEVLSDAICIQITHHHHNNYSLGLKLLIVTKLNSGSFAVTNGTFNRCGLIKVFPPVINLHHSVMNMVPLPSSRTFWMANWT